MDSAKEKNKINKEIMLANEYNNKQRGVKIHYTLFSRVPATLHLTLSVHP